MANKQINSTGSSDPDRPKTDVHNNPANSTDDGSSSSRSWIWWAVIGVVLVIILLFAASLVFGRPGQEGDLPAMEESQEPPDTGETPEDEDGELPPDLPDVEYEFTFTFENGDEAWVPGFADLPADYDEDFFELDSGWRQLPPELEGSAFYMQGHNRSDDLFMYIKNFLDGLEPNTSYQVTFYLDLATNIPEGMVGIGGSPGESVYVKVGATLIEPDVELDDQGWLRMNIDKGNQANEGQDMIIIGNIANPDIGEEEAGQFAIKEMDSEGRDFILTTNDQGVVWLIYGTDSGFEGLTTVYYDRIRVVFAPIDS